MSSPIVYNWVAADDSYVAGIQTLGAPGSIIFDGTYPAQTPTSLQFPGFSRTITLSSADDNSGVDFTINGQRWGINITETVTGPNAATVESINSFDTIFSITSSAAFTNISVGIGQTGQTNWFSFDYYRTFPTMTVQAIVTGTINYTFNSAIEDIVNLNPNLFPVIGNMANAVDNQIGMLFLLPMRYCNFTINSSTGAATLIATIIQEGVQ